MAFHMNIWEKSAFLGGKYYIFGLKKIAFCGEKVEVGLLEGGCLFQS